MGRDKLNIGFVRRGFSASGGAEVYLRRLAGALVSAGHEVSLFATPDWPEAWWPSRRPIRRIAATQPIAFADEVDRTNPWAYCDLFVSLERIWRCDVFRAGDGVHRAWLNRRAQFESRLKKIARRLNQKHNTILRLEQALLGDGGARHIVANSAMVRNEIVGCYGVPLDRVDVVANGVPVSEFGPAPLKREAARTQLGLGTEEVAVLFCGSGWDRKGLRYAIAAIDRTRDPRLRLLVAGKGSAPALRSRRVRYLGVIDVRLPLAAADVFILPTLYDPFSNASLEAMAAGLPVITTRANGCAEIIDHEVHGSIIERADDVNGLAKALGFWSEESRRSAARPALLERATEFDISCNVAHTMDVLLRQPLPATPGRDV